MASTGTVGNLVVNLSAHTGQFTTGLQKAGNEAKSFGNNIKTSLGSGAGGPLKDTARDIDKLSKTMGRVFSGGMPKLSSLAGLAEMGPMMIGVGAAAAVAGIAFIKFKQNIDANIDAIRKQNDELAKAGEVIRDYNGYLVARMDKAGETDSGPGMFTTNWIKAKTNIAETWTYWELYVTRGTKAADAFLQRQDQLRRDFENGRLAANGMSKALMEQAEATKKLLAARESLMEGGKKSGEGLRDKLYKESLGNVAPELADFMLGRKKLEESLRLPKGVRTAGEDKWWREEGLKRGLAHMQDGLIYWKKGKWEGDVQKSILGDYDKANKAQAYHYALMKKIKDISDPLKKSYEGFSKVMSKEFSRIGEAWDKLTSKKLGGRGGIIAGMGDVLRDTLNKAGVNDPLGDYLRKAKELKFLNSKGWLSDDLFQKNMKDLRSKTIAEMTRDTPNIGLAKSADKYSKEAYNLIAKAQQDQSDPKLRAQLDANKLLRDVDNKLKIVVKNTGDNADKVAPLPP